MTPLRIRAFATLLTLSSLALVACAAAPVDEEEETESESSALANRGGGGAAGLTASECTACGCSLVLVEKTDECRIYKCVCQTEAQARCAGGKARQVGVPHWPVRAVGVAAGAAPTAAAQ